MNSTQLIKAADADYKMLKGKGKAGEEVLHYNGFLDGYSRGFADATKKYGDLADVRARVLIGKACEWCRNHYREYVLGGEDMLDAFRKAMED